MISPKSLPRADVAPGCAPEARLAGPGVQIPALDGLRGLAVLMVVAFHIFQAEPVPSGSLARVAYLMTRLGQTGVDLFFVLSGFLITGILADAKGSSRYFSTFYARRSLRIFPLYYGVLAIGLVVLPRAFGVHPSGVAPAWLWTYTSNLPIALGAEGGTFGYFWTLAIEEQFYLIWPAVVFLAGRRALMRICLGCIAGAALARVFAESAGVSSFSFTPCRMDSLALGGWLALAARGPSGFKEFVRPAVAVVLVTLFVLAPIYAIKTGGGDPTVQVVKYTFIAAFYGALLVLAVAAPAGSPLGRAFRLRPLRGLGRLSYGMYVYHVLAIDLVAGALATPKLAPLGLGATGALWARVVAAFALAFAASWLSWHLFEAPLLRFKRYFRYGDEPAAARMPGPADRLALGLD